MSEQTHAVVIGGSMAGMLAARVLSDYFDCVSIIERDNLPDSPDYRNGVPQARHLHLLLSNGERLLEDFFPGFGAELETHGAPRILWGTDTRFMTKGGWLPKFDGELVGHTATRNTIDHVVRQRIQALTNVNILTEHDVKHLLCCNPKGELTGVQVRSRKDRSEQVIKADFIVDTSGRGSKAPEWLANMGYGTVQETTVNANLGYATRWYRIPEGVTFDWTTLAIQSVPALNISRYGGAFIVEGNQLVVTLAGTNGDYPPTDEDEFLAFAKTLASPLLYNIMKDLEPTSGVYGYRRTANRVRHFEKLARMPERFIVMGDAACAFNPIYGQGMTTAALQANELRRLLQTSDVSAPGFSMQFQKALAKSVKQPWLMATGEDLRYPETEGEKPNFADRVVQQYIDAVFTAMPYDTELAKVFVKVMNLQSPATALFHPRFIGSLVQHNILNKREIDIEPEFAPQYAWARFAGKH